MRRLPRTTAALAGAFALLAIFAGSSCAAITPSAARIDGAEFRGPSFEDELEAILANDAYVQQLEQGGGQIRGDGRGTLRSAFVANVLSVRIIFELIHQEAERQEVAIPRAVRDFAEADVVNQVGGPEVLAAFDEEYRRYLLRRWAEVLALQLHLAEASIAEEDLRAVYRESADQFSETCVSHILVSVVDPGGGINFEAVEQQAAGLEAEAGELRQRIEGGADFGDIAREESVDPGSAARGGELGCAPPGQYVPEFEDAVASLEPGVVSQPVRTEFGYHLILVTDRRAAPFEEVVDQLRQRVLQESQQPLQQFLQERLAESDIDVNPRYGHYESDSRQVIPPEGPTGEGQRSSRAPTVPAPLP